MLQIHGWRMKNAEKTNFAETSFKRLYWSGYKGQFTALSWPTGWHTKPANKYGAWQIPYLLGHEQNYNNSEAVARLTAPKLSEWLSGHAHGTNSHNSHVNLHIIAHSMGNVLVSEALKSIPENIVTSYTASQAAESAGVYDSNAANVNHEIVALTTCLTDIGSNRGPEYAWRCYNKENSNGLMISTTVFDMPPDMWRYNWIRRNAEDVPIDMDNAVIASGGNYVVEHGATNDKVEPTDNINMGANDLGNHYYKDIGAKTRILNFYNNQDAALTGWEFNQLLKPDFKTNSDTEFTWHYRSTYHVQYKAYEQSYQDCITTRINDVNRYSICDSDPTVQSLKPNDALTYQAIFERDGQVVAFNDAMNIDIMSHVIPARTEPLGQVGVENKQQNNSTVEIFDNIQMVGFTDSNQDHSAPFHGYYSEITPKPNLTTQQRAVYWNLVLERSFRYVDGIDYTGLKNNIQ